MVTETLLLIFKRVLCAILCQFCDCCEDNDNCPDGVCIDLRQAIDELERETPTLLASDPKVSLPEMNIDWAELQATIAAITAAVKQLTKFFGVSR